MLCVEVPAAKIAPRAACRLKCHLRSELSRWLRDGKIHTSVAIPVRNRTLWAWNDVDIAKGKKV